MAPLLSLSNRLRKVEGRPTVGFLNAGRVGNVIPQWAEMSGTTRTLMIPHRFMTRITILTMTPFPSASVISEL